MNKIFTQILILLLIATDIWYSTTHLNNIPSITGIFIAGLLSGIFLMNLLLNVKNNKLNLYKRELEKESISSTESDAKVKILEGKIAVLEKTLEKFLTK